ncbi:MAG: hypothetical protein WBZ36_19385 [Candidatus Nitrosopolaris sp.]
MSVIMIMEEVYDSLLQAQKHIMLKNGNFEFDSLKQGSCCCGHSVTEHLDYTDCCLSKEFCPCDRFLDKESKATVTIPQKEDGKLPRKKEDVLLLQKQKEQIEDRQLDNYIQTLARM